MTGPDAPPPPGHDASPPARGANASFVVQSTTNPSLAAPPGYLGAEARVRSGPAPELVAAGYELELADAPLLHRGLGLADLAHVIGLAEGGVIAPG